MKECCKNGIEERSTSRLKKTMNWLVSIVIVGIVIIALLVQIVNK